MVDSIAENVTERINLQIRVEMRDSLNDIARQLQRSRREKGGGLPLILLCVQRFRVLFIFSILRRSAGLVRKRSC